MASRTLSHIGFLAPRRAAIATPLVTGPGETGRCDTGASLPSACPRARDGRDVPVHHSRVAQQVSRWYWTPWARRSAPRPREAARPSGDSPGGRPAHEGRERPKPQGRPSCSRVSGDQWTKAPQLPQRRGTTREPSPRDAPEAPRTSGARPPRTRRHGRLRPRDWRHPKADRRRLRFSASPSVMAVLGFNPPNLGTRSLQACGKSKEREPRPIRARQGASREHRPGPQVARAHGGSTPAGQPPRTTGGRWSARADCWHALP